MAPHDADGTLLATRLIGAVGQHKSTTPSPGPGDKTVQELAGNLPNLVHVGHDFVALREWRDFKIPIINFLEQDKLSWLDGLVRSIPHRPWLAP